MQLDTGSKYYKAMIDGMVQNFKRAVAKASERVFAGNNMTSIKPISLASSQASAPSQDGGVSLEDLQVEGLSKPRVTNVYVNKKNMKLHVMFSFKSVRVTGRCGSTGSSSSAKASSSKSLLEASYWNASWSASLMPMIGRDHFDMSKVYTTHSQQKLVLGAKECVGQDKLKGVLVDKVRGLIDGRLVEIMELVMMHPESLAEQAGQVEAKRPRRDSKLASSSKQEDLTRFGRPQSGGWSPMESSTRALRRSKRQTPCQAGEELDDYVDQLFRFGTRIVRAMEPITLPNATIELPDYNLKIFLYEGKGTRAYKFRRAKSAWVFCSNETISLGLTIEVEELRVAYKYRVISGTRLVFDGDLEAKLSPKVQAQFSQAVQEEDSEEPVQQRVDRLRVFRLGRVHVLIRGLGNLTQSLSMLINSYLNDNQEELQPTFRMVEGDAVRMVNRMLANVNVPLLSVV